MYRVCQCPDLKKQTALLSSKWIKVSIKAYASAATIRFQEMTKGFYVCGIPFTVYYS